MAGATPMAKIPGTYFQADDAGSVRILLTDYIDREKVPPRPQGQRAEPTTNNPFSGFSLNSIPSIYVA